MPQIIGSVRILEEGEDYVRYNHVCPYCGQEIGNIQNDRRFGAGGGSQAHCDSCDQWNEVKIIY